MSCPHCGRTFLEDRLQVHLRSCKPTDAGRRSIQAQCTPKQTCTPVFVALPHRQSQSSTLLQKSASAQSREGMPPSRGPKMIECRSCGRAFGRASIGIHEKQCLAKATVQDVLKRPEEPTAPWAKSSSRSGQIGSESTAGFSAEDRPKVQAGGVLAMLDVIMSDFANL